MRFKTNSWVDVLTHIGVIISIIVFFLSFFFFIYLPWTTHHGKKALVPKLKGLHVEQLEKILDEKNLSYEVNDCTYVENIAPLTVVGQFPAEGAKVKEGRKVYVVLTNRVPPKTKVPSLVGLSLKSAENQLRVYGLQLGEVKYVKDLRQNTVIDQEVKGLRAEVGSFLPKGTKIDLLVGDGIGESGLTVPNLQGMDLEDAKTALRGVDLLIGNIHPESSKSGKIVKQKPSSGTGVHAGDLIDLWVED